MESCMQFLKDKITDTMPVDDIVDVFEQMCGIPIEEDVVLFEAGTMIDFSGEPVEKDAVCFEDGSLIGFSEERVFVIALVRQFPNDAEDDEFIQIHVDIVYKPTDANEKLHNDIWDVDLDESIFDYIRQSEALAYARAHEYTEVKIYMAET